MTNIEKAKAHIADVNKRFPEQITSSIAGTRIYRGTGPEVDSRDNSSHVRLIQADSVSCLMELDESEFGNICVLNYASYKYPGGMFLLGSMSQEEALCHESTLYPVLKAFDDSYYQDNRSYLNRALYTNAALLSPDIIFEHDGQTKMANVLTCAAPNWGTANLYRHVSKAENDKVFQNRINFIFKILKFENIDTLIAGAWGCGVFGQDAKDTCKMFLNAKNLPANLIFAIPGDYHYNKFEEACDEFYRTHYI